MNILFATTNKDKFNKAKLNLESFGVKLKHEVFEMQELQTADGEKIVRDKVTQAYQHFKQPVLVNDDTWSIPALRGFPSTGMKLCNDFLLAEDWLQLMNGKEDRRILLISHYAYHDGRTIRVAVEQDERFFLDKAQGSYPKSPSLEVIARMNSTASIAEEIAAGRKIEENKTDFWKSLADLLQK